MESMSTARSNQILALLATAALMGVLDFSIVNVALPSSQHTFHLLLHLIHGRCTAPMQA